jgi:hypothetical protein
VSSGRNDGVPLTYDCDEVTVKIKT